MKSGESLADNGDASENEVNSDADFIPSTPVKPSHKRINYSFDESNMIIKLFGSFIRSNDLITKANVEKMVKAEPKMASLLQKFGLRSLLVKFRTERGKLKK